MCAPDSYPSEKTRRPRKPSRWKRLAKRLTLLATTLLLLAVVAEFATRLLTDVVPPLVVRDPAVGQHYIRSFREEVFIEEADRKVLLRFNRSGFRGSDRPFEKPEGVRRVAVFGDSMVASLAVDEEDTMVCRLERMLSESHPRVKWEVFNFGVTGASPGQALALYRKLASRWDPDIVLCAFLVGNDLADNCRRLSHNPRIYFDLDDEGHPYQLPFSASRAKASSFLNRHSRFYVWQKGAVSKATHLVRKRAQMLSPGQWIFCRQENDDVAHAWKLSGRIHEAFHREAADRGALFAVVILPVSSQIYDEGFQQVLDCAGELAEHFDQNYPEQRLAALCREAGVPFLSMTADFRKAAPARSIEAKQQWLFHGGNGHFNEQGNLLAARLVHGFLTRGDPQQVAGRPYVNRLR